MKVKKYYGVFRVHRVDSERAHGWNGTNFLGMHERYEKKEWAEDGVKRLLLAFPDVEFAIMELYQVD